MELCKDILYVGVADKNIDLFEGLYEAPEGMRYNSYVILDDRIAVIDSVDGACVGEWLENLNQTLKNRIPDYLIVQHMEPDHSAGIGEFMKRYPKAVLVASAKAFPMLRAFFGTEYENRRKVVKEGEKLSLGKHSLTFFMAPLVHWPEVMVTYESTEKLLFSADAFGTFGTESTEDDWACEARRYYFGIVGKFGAPVQVLLNKARRLDIRMICPLHGPVLKEHPEQYLNLYHTWSSYEAETKGILIAYTSVYGNTKKAVEYLADRLKEEGCPEVVLFDLCRESMSEAVEQAFRYPAMVFASITYNGSVFPPMREFLLNLKERNFQNRKIAIIENGAWAPAAGKAMQSLLAESKNLSQISSVLTLTGALTDVEKQELSLLAKELCEELS